MSADVKKQNLRKARRLHTALDAPTHILYWLEICREAFRSGQEAGQYPSGSAELGYRLVGIAGNATRAERLAVFNPLYRRVGAPFKWDKRIGYINRDGRGPGIDALLDRLIHERSALYILEFQEEAVGMCFISQPKGRIDCVEIEKFGLFPEFKGRGHGRHFLTMIFGELFEKYNLVELNTRSTNQPGIVEFYESMGMTCREASEQPTDIMSDAEFEDWYNQSA